MRTVGIRELKNRLSEYLRLVGRGEDILITDRGRVIAELHQPGPTSLDSPYPALLLHARQGWVRLGAPNRPDLYPDLKPLVPLGEAAKLLDQERSER